MIVLYMGSLGEWRERDDCALHGKFLVSFVFDNYLCLK